MLGKRIDRVTKDHLGRALATGRPLPSIVVPLRIVDDQFFYGIREKNGEAEASEDFFRRLFGDASWHLWEPDSEPVEWKPPSDRIPAAIGQSIWDEQMNSVRSILDELHARLKKLEGKGD